MEKHWNNYCTMSIVHFMAFPATLAGEAPMLESVMKIAGDPFFGGIEIGQMKNADERAHVKKALEVAHIGVRYAAQTALTMNKLNLNSLNEPQRMLAVEKLLSSIDQAAEMGANRVGFLSGSDPGPAQRPEALEALAQSVKQAAAYAQDKDIQLVLETFDYDIDKKCLIGPNHLAAEFCHRIRQDFPGFGLLCDLSHVPLQHETSAFALNQVKDCLVHIHVGNCVLDPKLPGYGDLHPRFGWPGGVNDVPELAEFIRQLFAISYLAEGRQEKPWVGFEVKPQSPDESSEMVIAGAKRTWQAAWELA